VPGLEEFLERWGLIAGVSRQMNGLEQLQDRYLQAQAVLEKGRLLERRHRCYRFDSLSSYLLFDRIEERELAKYCHEQIQQLWNYDQAHGSELCPTLQVYLEQAKSLAKTSEILYIHRNTVRYRINRCMELLGNRLEDGNEIFAYILSLRILEYETKICRTAGQGW
jgi:DNA-binding PucR family transcriptional regulator